MLIPCQRESIKSQPAMAEQPVTCDERAAGLFNRAKLTPSAHFAQLRRSSVQRQGCVPGGQPARPNPAATWGLATLISTCSPASWTLAIGSPGGACHPFMTSKPHAEPIETGRGIEQARGAHANELPFLQGMPMLGPRFAGRQAPFDARCFIHKRFAEGLRREDCRGPHSV